MSKQTPSQVAQRSHRHRLGSITFCMRLLQWHLNHDKQIPRKVRLEMENAVNRLYDAGHYEACNISFKLFNWK